ncbi:MAG: hypothetical protein AAGF84_08420 [Planctomycetota bacterium]
MDWERRYPALDENADGQLAGTPLGRAIDALPGTVMVLAGLTLIAMAMLVPAWRELDRLDAQRTFIAEQAEALTEQQERYEGFHAALAAEDPVLIERLAYTQLRREPIDRETVSEAGVSEALSPYAEVLSELPPGDIDRWLRVEPPSPGQSEVWDASPEVLAGQSDSRLVRLAGGTMRFVLLAAGAMCVVAGLWWGPSVSRIDPDNA